MSSYSKASPRNEAGTIAPGGPASTVRGTAWRVGLDAWLQAATSSTAASASSRARRSALGFVLEGEVEPGPVARDLPVLDLDIHPRDLRDPQVTQRARGGLDGR